MKVTLFRTHYLVDRTLGIMKLEDYDRYFATLELPKREHKPRCIPNGNYIADQFMSQKANGRTFKLKSVPNFSNIIIHPGNFPKDTEGCILISLGFLEDDMGKINLAPKSKRAMDLFREETAPYPRINIEIKDLFS